MNNFGYDEPRFWLNERETNSICFFTLDVFIFYLHFCMTFYDYYFSHAFFNMCHCWQEHIFSYFFQCLEIYIFLNLPHSHSSGYKLRFWWIPNQKLSIGDRSGDLGGYEKFKLLGPPQPSIRYNWQLIIESAPHYLWPVGRYKQIKGITNGLKALYRLKAL